MADIIQIIRNDTNEIYTFQTTSSFSSNDSSTVTNNPTSEGTPRTDNIYNNPRTFDVSVQVGGNENVTDIWGSGEERPKNAYSLLKYLKDRAVQLSIITPQADYLNMFLTNINLNNSTNNAYNFSAGLQFKELFIAKFETITVGPFINASTSANNSQTQNNGNNAGSFLGSAFNGMLELSETMAVYTVGGAALGTAIPVIGNVAGAVIGGIVGAVVQCVDWITGG